MLRFHVNLIVSKGVPVAKTFIFRFIVAIYGLIGPKDFVSGFVREHDPATSSVVSCSAVL